MLFYRETHVPKSITSNLHHGNPQYCSKDINIGNNQLFSRSRVHAQFCTQNNKHKDTKKSSSYMILITLLVKNINIIVIDDDGDDNDVFVYLNQ